LRLLRDGRPRSRRWPRCGRFVHALRGWPTPVGVALNSTVKLFDDDSNCLDKNAKEQLKPTGQQVFQFARMGMAMKS
jgi:FMN reductase